MANPRAHRYGHRLEVRYDARPGVREELTWLANAEAECCTFVTWSVGEIDGDPLLVVSAPSESPDSVEPIAALFGAPQARPAR